MGKAIDLTGQRFGRLTAICRTYDRGPHREILWRCICDCGNEKILRSTSLRNGDVLSCGCLRREAVSKKMIEYHKKLKAQKKEKENKQPVVINKDISDDLWMFGDFPQIKRLQTMFH